MRIDRNITLTGSAGRPFLLDVYAPENGQHHPLVLFVHGFKGFKDWGCWDLVGRAFARAGFVFVKFNFSHNGTTLERPQEFGDLEAFGRNNFSRELDDLGTVLDWVLSGERLHQYGIDYERVALLGHSRGGATVLLKAREDERVKVLVTWAAVSNLDVYKGPEEAVQAWKQQGVVFIENARTGQQMPLYYQLHEDLMQHADRLDMEEALRSMTIPYLVLHGSIDPTVPYAAALHLYENSSNSELETLMGADHSFGGKHPWDSPELPHDMALAVDKTVDYLGRVV